MRARRRSGGSLAGYTGLDRQQAVNDLPVFRWRLPERAEPASTKRRLLVHLRLAAVLLPLASRWLLLLRSSNDVWLFRLASGIQQPVTRRRGLSMIVPSGRGTQRHRPRRSLRELRSLDRGGCVR